MNELNRLVAKAVTHAQGALELDSSARLRGPEIPIVLEESALLMIRPQLPPLSELRRRLAQCAPPSRSWVVSQIESALKAMDARFVRELSEHPRVELDVAALEDLLFAAHGPAEQRFMARMGQRVLERILGERVTPPLRLRWESAMTPTELGEELPGRFQHALVVGELLFATEEIFPLILDAYGHDLRCFGEVMLNVIGVHQSWLNESGEATRLIYYNHARRELLECELAQPLKFQSCQCLYLGREETRLHEALGGKLSAIMQVNSYELSSFCDDKYRTATVLQEEGVRTPKAAIVSGERAGALCEVLADAGLDNCTSLVVQPNRGTEGAGAAVLQLNRGDAGSLIALEAYVAQLFEQGCQQVLIRERIDGVRLIAEEISLATSTRINVCWDGNRGHAESAYVQIAGPSLPEIASVGRGGAIVTLSQDIMATVGITHDELSLLRCAASAAVVAVVRAVNPAEAVALLGVDVLLERTEKGSFAWILEINSRPAGLSHSDLLDTCEPGVSAVMFETLLRRLISACDCGTIGFLDGAAARPESKPRESNRGQSNTAN